jgi:hypothetical protein
MLKKLMITTAAAALMAGTAIAQAPDRTAPAPKMESPSPAPRATTPAPKGDAAPMTQGQRAAGSAQFVNQQTADQWLASKFKGTDVIGNENEKIGDVSDVLFDQNGKVLAYIVGVGGFLGIGSKDVAIAPASFQIHRDAKDRDELKLKLAMSKDDLKNAPEFKTYQAPRTAAPTTGQAPDRNRTPATQPK